MRRDHRVQLRVFPHPVEPSEPPQVRIFPHPVRHGRGGRSIVMMRQGEDSAKPFAAVNGFNGQVPWVSGGLGIGRRLF